MSVLLPFATRFRNQFVRAPSTPAHIFSIIRLSTQNRGYAFSKMQSKLLSIARAPVRRHPRMPNANCKRSANRHYSGSSKPAQEQVAEKAKTLSERMKDLSKRYGYAALGVYLGLSALDFPFCFLAVRMLGPERVGEAEHYVVNGFWNLVGQIFPKMKPVEHDAAAVEEAVELKARADASIWTQLLIAYGVHKSLIVFRVPLTAAVTPNIVKYLRKRGWNIGKPKAS